MNIKNGNHNFLQGGGEMAELIRAKDWSKTSLGDFTSWPQSLCTIVSLMLDNPIGMYIAWGYDYIQLYNDGYRPILGATKHPHALGISTRETFPEIWNIVGPMFDGVMKGKAVGFTDFMLPLDRNGFLEECYFDFSYTPIRNDDGEVGGILATVIETTNKRKAEQALKESEQRFRSLAQNLPQLVWITDAQGNLEFSSVKWKEYTGIEPGGEKEWKAIVHPDDYDNINAAWMHCLTTGNIYASDVRLKNSNGEYRWHTVIGEPVLDNENKIIKWVGALTDTHSEKLFMQELELKVKERTNELQQFNIELERKNKELESFAYISSHDLQEPLRKIQTFATRIIEKEYEVLSESGKDNFKRMQDAAKRMQTLIQDLLIYSKTNATERNFEQIDLNKVIDEVKEDLSEELKDKHAIIETTGLCDVKIIPFQFRQLMHNLIGNALKFSVHNIPPYIKIKSEIAKGAKFNNEKLNPKNKYCHITVSDNGIGFEQQYNEKIFEVFQRLHGKSQYNGTGIGLAIVKKIVENHEGIITASSELNKGATFDIYIPVT